MASLVESFHMTTVNRENTVLLRLESRAISVFDGSKHTLVSPVSAGVEVPLIDKRNGQVISISGKVLQIMDLETFEVFETSAIEQDIIDKVHQGGEVEYWKVLDRIKVERVKS